MKKVLILTVLIANLFLLNNCSADSKSENVFVDKRVLNTNSQNINAGVIENGNIAATPVTDSNNSNIVQSNSPTNTNRGRLAQSNINGQPKSALIPAPHNSSVATTMNERNEFMQIRIFNSNAQIQKMEKNVTTEKTKVFLKNGKVLDVPAGKTFDFINASPQEILIAVGLLQKPDDSQTGAKD